MAKPLVLNNPHHTSLLSYQATPSLEAKLHPFFFLMEDKEEIRRLPPNAVLDRSQASVGGDSPALSIPRLGEGIAVFVVSTVEGQAIATTAVCSELLGGPAMFVGNVVKERLGKATRLNGLWRKHRSIGDQSPPEQAQKQ